jgi:phosphinothricin acetyltransferase
MNFTIDGMQASDWPQIAAIYQEGIATGNATFETDVPPWETWDAAHRHDCRLVARNSEHVLGCAESRVQPVCVWGRG